MVRTARTRRSLEDEEGLMMEERDLFALLVLMIERSGGVLEVTKDEVTNLDMEGKVLAIVPDTSGDLIKITVEKEEDVDAEYTEG